MNAALALLSAALLVLTFAPFDFVWLAPIAVTPLLIAVARERSFRRGFFLGWICGVAYWFGVCHWIQYTLAEHGGMGVAVAWVCFVLFCFAKALQMAVFAGLAGMAMGRVWAIPAVAALWVAIEWTHGPLGFAWLDLGNAASDMSMPLRLAPITGVYGISFLFVVSAAALALAVLRRPRAHLAWLLLMPLTMVLPPAPVAHRGINTAILVQPNISETEQWTPGSFTKLEEELSLMSLSAVVGRDKKPDVIVWPEAPAPFYENDPRYREFTAGLARSAGTYFLTGVIGRPAAGAMLNSAWLIGPDGAVVSRYDKVNLVPFGEFVPWPLGGIAPRVSTETGEFQSGSRVVVSTMGAHPIGTFICYESVFPNFIRKFAKGGAQVLFNISNDGWFGKTAARDQHLRIVRMRAAENRRWILRATNDGITASIDPAGRLIATAPALVEIASRVHYDYISQTTFYTEHGDWFVLLCVLSGAAALIPPSVISRAGLRVRRHP